MSRFNRLRPSPAMVVALIALFVAMGGAGYAAATGSIDTREIKNNTVRTQDIRNGAILSADVKDDALTGADVLESGLGEVPRAARADRATDATNATNATNAANAAKVGVNGVDVAAIQPYSIIGTKIKTPVLRTGAVALIGANGDFATATASCGNGERAIGGGAEYDGTFPNDTTPFPGGILDSYPTSHLAWTARAYNGSATTRSFRVHVLCVPDV